MDAALVAAGWTEAIAVVVPALRTKPPVPRMAAARTTARTDSLRTLFMMFASLSMVRKGLAGCLGGSFPLGNPGLLTGNIGSLGGGVSHQSPDRLLAAAGTEQLGD